MQSLSAIRAVRGSNSEIIMPGIVVAIGRKSPRISAGASGLGSQVECCGGPPIKNKTMHDLALPNVELPVAAATAGAGDNRLVRLSPAPR